VQAILRVFWEAGLDHLTILCVMIGDGIGVLHRQKFYLSLPRVLLVLFYCSFSCVFADVSVARNESMQHPTKPTNPSKRKNLPRWHKTQVNHRRVAIRRLILDAKNWKRNITLSSAVLLTMALRCKWKVMKCANK